MQRRVVTAAVVILVLLSSCLSTPDGDILPTERWPENGDRLDTPPTHWFVEIEGMPCVVVSSSRSQLGVSCDWSQWEGR